MLHLQGSVARLAHVVAELERVLDAEEAGPVAGGHRLLHLLLGDVRTSIANPDCCRQVIELAPIQLEEFWGKQRVRIKSIVTNRCYGSYRICPNIYFTTIKEMKGSLNFYSDQNQF